MSDINEMRNSSMVKERDLGNGIHSFNFTSKCFHKQVWNDLTVKARGLFYDMDNDKVLARSYDKFFAFGERPETEYNYFAKNATYPIYAYEKLNGFLGILSIDNSGHFFVASKSTNQGKFAGYFKELLDIHFEKNDCDTNALYSYMKKNDCSLVFEVVDIEHDPHIVQYLYSEIYLLDIIKNDLSGCQKAGYSEVERVAREFEFDYKLLEAVLNDQEQLSDFIEGNSNHQGIEGFVFEDSDGRMVKYKTQWYRYWKNLRGIMNQLNAGKAVEDIKALQKMNQTEAQVFLDGYFYFIKCRGRVPQNIIELRNGMEVDIAGYLMV